MQLILPAGAGVRLKKMSNAENIFRVFAQVVKKAPKDKTEQLMTQYTRSKIKSDIRVCFGGC